MTVAAAVKVDGKFLLTDLFLSFLLTPRKDEMVIPARIEGVEAILSKNL